MIRLLLGIIIVMGSVGTLEFYDECLAAADCVAGTPPSMLAVFGQALLGISIMAWAAYDFNKGYK